MQAKDWKDPVDQGEVFKFKTVLDDLRANPRVSWWPGLDFSKAPSISRRRTELSSTISRATRIAAHSRCQYRMGPTAHLRLPQGIISATEEDFNSSGIYAMGFEWNVVTPHYSGIHFDASPDWFRNEYPAAQIAPGAGLSWPPVPVREMHLCDGESGSVKTLASLFLPYAQAMDRDGVEQNRIHLLFWARRHSNSTRRSSRGYE